jgi:hypothetical protein
MDPGSGGRGAISAFYAALDRHAGHRVAWFGGLAIRYERATSDFAFAMTLTSQKDEGGRGTLWS